MRVTRLTRFYRKFKKGQQVIIIDNRNSIAPGRTFRDITIYPFHDAVDEVSNATHYIRIVSGVRVWVDAELPTEDISPHGAQALAEAWAEAARLAVLMSNNPNVSIRGEHD